MSQDPMHICIIGDTGGVHVRNRALAFSRLGHRIDTVTQRPGGGEELNERTPHTKRIGISYMFEYYRLLRECPGRVVHIHYPSSLGAWLWLVTGSTKPLLVSVMGGDILFDEQGDLPASARWMTRQVLQRADHLTAKSDYLVQALIALGVAENKIDKVIWGVDHEVFRPGPSDGLRTELGLNPDDRIILSPRILRPHYNIHVIIEALPAVLSRFPEARLMVTEYEADAAYRDGLKSRCRELEISESVIFTGIVPFEKMPAYYNLADVIVGIPSSDGFPQTMLEGMACETPNVVSRLKRYEELVADGESAKFVDTNADSVAAGIIDILADADTARRIGQAGRELVIEKASFPQNIKRVEELYRRLDALPSRPATPFWVRLGCLAILAGLALRNTMFGRT